MRSRNRTCRSYVLKNSGRHFVVAFTCGFFTSGYLERFPVTGVSAHSLEFPGYVFPRATVTPNSCEAPVTGNRPDGARRRSPPGPDPDLSRILVMITSVSSRFL